MTTPVALGPCTARVLDLIGACSGDVGPASTDALAEIEQELRRPLRVAVTGRVNAGKSTLVNALLRRRIAPTDVTECTRYACWFRYGVPERVEVVAPDGSRRRVGLRPDGRLPAAITDLDDIEVDRIEVFLSDELLEHLTVVDTPGLSTARDDVQSTADVLALDRRTRSALLQVDAMVFLVAGDVRADDVDRLRDFHALMGGLTPTSVSTLAVLSRVDQAVAVGTDPIAAFRPVAAALTSNLRAVVADVLPVVALQAETAECGVLTDADLRLLGALAHDRPRFDRALLSVDRFVRGDGLPGDEASRTHLLDLLDLHGLHLMADAAADTAAPSELVARLRAASGIAAVRRAIVEQLGGRADLLKANWALGAVQDLGFRVPPDERDALVDLAERLELDPALHRISEVSALQEVAAGHTDLAAVDIEELRRLVHGDTQHERLGVVADAAPDAVHRAALDAAARWRTAANDGTAGPALRSVAGTLARSYELLLMAPTTTGDPG